MIYPLATQDSLERLAPEENKVEQDSKDLEVTLVTAPVLEDPQVFLGCLDLPVPMAALAMLDERENLVTSELLASMAVQDQLVVLVTEAALVVRERRGFRTTPLLV